MRDPNQFSQPEPPPQPPSPSTSSRRRWLTVGVLILGVGLTVLFALRTARSFRTFHNERGRPPREATGNIEPWMTIPYVAAAYGVPDEFLYAQLGLDGKGLARKSLMQLERKYFGGERGLLRARLQAALELYYSDSALPTPIVPDPASIPMPEMPPPGGPPPDASAPDSAPPNAGATP